MEGNLIARINELARKSKAEGLTASEREEQAQLRQQYLEIIRTNIRNQLNNIDIIDENGNIENLGEKYGKKGN